MIIGGSFTRLMNQDESADLEIGQFFDVGIFAADGIESAGNGGDSGVGIKAFSGIGRSKGIGSVLSVAEACKIAQRFKASGIFNSIEGVKTFIGEDAAVGIENGDISASKAAPRRTGTIFGNLRGGEIVPRISDDGDRRAAEVRNISGDILRIGGASAILNAESSRVTDAGGAA